MSSLHLSFVIPVYNEKENVSQLFGELADVLRQLPHTYEIIFVDDGSTDGTAEELEKLWRGAEDRVCVIQFVRNFGKSAALRAGFAEARGELIVTLDGDLQDNPHEIPRFLETFAAGKYDLLCGWKFERKDPLSKKIPSRIANGVSSLFTKAKIHDMNCGFKIFRADVAKSLFLYGDMHRFIPAIVAGRGFRVGEIKINHRPRVHGASKYGGRRLFASAFDFLALLFMLRFREKPLHFFGGAGLAIGLMGAGILGYLGWVRIVEGEFISGRPLTLLGILLVIVGIQLFSLGFIGELLVNLHSSREKIYLIKKKRGYRAERDSSRA